MQYLATTKTRVKLSPQRIIAYLKQKGCTKLANADHKNSSYWIYDIKNITQYNIINKFAIKKTKILCTCGGIYTSKNQYEQHLKQNRHDKNIHEVKKEL